jgi:hypothetical protein
MAIGKYTLTGAGIGLLKTKLFTPLTVESDQATRTSYFGTPVFSNLEIKPFKWQTLENETIEIKNGISIDHCLMSISQQKNIVTTPIAGLNGTVKEYISDGDFTIDIEGTISSKQNVYPEKEVNELIQILKAQTNLTLISEFLNWFGISSVVVTNYDLPQTEGFRNIQEFRISLLSDNPVELEEI